MTTVVDERGQPSTEPCSGGWCFLSDVISWRNTASDELRRAQARSASMNGEQLNELRKLHGDYKASPTLSSFEAHANYYAAIAQSARNLADQVGITPGKPPKDPDQKPGGDDDDDDDDDDWPDLPDLPKIPDVNIPDVSGTLRSAAIIAVAGLGIAGLVYTYPLMRRVSKK